MVMTNVESMVHGPWHCYLLHFSSFQVSSLNCFSFFSLYLLASRLVSRFLPPVPPPPATIFMRSSEVVRRRSSKPTL